MLTVCALGSVYIGTDPEQLNLCLLSLFKQTKQLDELILVCDGPILNEVDHTICRFERSNSRLRVFRLNVNRGLGPALNYGLHKSSSDLILRFDTDDISSLNRNEQLYSLFHHNPGITVAGSFVEEFVPSTEEFCTSVLKSVPLSCEDIIKQIHIRNPFNHNSVLFRRMDILSIGSYDDVRYFEDYYLWLKLRRAGYYVLNTSIATVFMRRSSILERRVGFSYFRFELYFIFKSYRNSLISFTEFLLFLFRAFFRLMFPSTFVLRLVMFWRSKPRLIRNPDMY